MVDFPNPQATRLPKGVSITDVATGRYLRIDLSSPRPEPEEFAFYGEFDTFTVLNPQAIPKGRKIWLYLNSKQPENMFPLHHLSRIETIASRFYLQHEFALPGVELEILLGGDLRGLRVEPVSKGMFEITSAVEMVIQDDITRQLGTVHVDNPVEITKIMNDLVIQSPNVEKIIIGTVPKALGNRSRRMLSIANMSIDNTIFLGPNNVSTENGFPLFPKQTVTMRFDPDNFIAIYGVAEQDVEVRIWEW